MTYFESKYKFHEDVEWSFYLKSVEELRFYIWNT